MTNNPELAVGEQSYGFCVNRIVNLNEPALILYELEHIETKAKYIHLANADTENSFGVSFKTVPRDSTGVAHILEHTVLCGSKKYPVHDPFFSMIRRSMKSFMNAFTSSDWTMYPFSTQNEKDYYNLMKVYLDAAFFPLLNELSFKQEGHRLEFDPENNLVYKGVVYSEMKGAMSSPNQIMYHSLSKTLYPTSTYGNNSGGDPKDIPNLSYEQFKTFHSIHYHPSNAFFYSYGSFPLKKHLEVIEENVLHHFKAINPNTNVEPEHRWDSPCEATYYYPLEKNEKPEKKSQVCIAWLMCGIENTIDVLSLSILNQILLGNSGAPLKKALIDSGLGSALSDGTGYESDIRDTFFSCGLKDVNEKDADAIEQIIFDVFKKEVKNGVDKELFETVLHQMEFNRKEITNTPYPYGIKLLTTIAGLWFHGGDPIRILKFDNDVATIRQKITEGPYLENLIKTYFLDNPHRVKFRLLPDQEMLSKENERICQELKEIEKRLSQSEKEKILQDAEKLKLSQDSNEDLSCLPTLTIEDIPRTINFVHETSAYDTTISYDQPTNGICYVTNVIPIDVFPDEVIKYIPLLCNVFTQMGTKDRDYVSLARLIDRYTGGIGLGFNVRTRFDDSGKCLPFLMFSGKCLERNLDNMFDLISEIFIRYDFSNITRLSNLLREMRARIESGIVSKGHSYAMSLAARNISTTTALSELWSGIYQYQTIKEITETLSDDNLEKLALNLSKLIRILFSKNHFKTAIVGSDKSIAKATDRYKIFKQELSERKNTIDMQAPKLETISAFFGKDRISEGWYTSSSVSFVARSWPTVRLNDPDSPVLSVISKLLKSVFLLRELREKGGAYGVFAISNAEDGLFYLSSYRDPNIVNTLNVYDRVQSFLCDGKSFDESFVQEAILQVCAEIDKPDPPSVSSLKAYYRKLIGLSDEVRLNFKHRVLEVTKERIMQVGNKYFSTLSEKGNEVIVSGKELIDNANEKLTGKSFVLHKI